MSSLALRISLPQIKQEDGGAQEASTTPSVPPIRNLPTISRELRQSMMTLTPINIRSPQTTTSPSPKPTGYSWQKLQETIRLESKAHGIFNEDDDDDDSDEDDDDMEDGEVDESEDATSASNPRKKRRKSSFSMLISAVLCK